MAHRQIILNSLRIEMARVSQGLLRHELAEKAGVSLSALNRACQTGRAGIRVARSIARALDVDLATLWQGISPDGRASA
jgi:transcriptional regulator with XRE-family HTH domain